MEIKSNYFDDFSTELNSAISEEVDEFDDSDEFREELYNKLYTFLKKYFSKSGGIYFSYTPYDEKIYEQVYDNNDDVTLFWKTHMLYYVKTDTIWEEMTIEDKEIDDQIYDVEFDVSNIGGKTASEKKDIDFSIEEIKQASAGEKGTIRFSISYSTYGMSNNKTNDVRRELKRDGVKIDNEDLRALFETFKQQNEVDFFINKNAEDFLKEQFDLWVKEYLLNDESVFDETRLAKIKSIKKIAYQIIEFVSQFEEELAAIWNKPKFVLQSEYVLTLDVIAEKESGIDVIAELVASEGWSDQLNEWVEQGYISDEEIDSDSLFKSTLDGREIEDDYKFLPIDTKHYTDEQKHSILSLFDDLSESIDGHLIHSENYQALNSLAERYRRSIDAIYIDPPFNKEEEAAYDYRVKYKDSTWVTLLENRISIAKEMMSDESSIFVRCDYNGNHYVHSLLSQLFGEDNLRNELIVKRGSEKEGLYGQSHMTGFDSLGVMYDTLYWYTKDPNIVFDDVEVKREERREPSWHDFKKYDGGNPQIDSMNYEVWGVDTESHFGWMWEKSRGRKAAENYREFIEKVGEDRIDEVDDDELHELLEEYWLETGEKKDFLRKNENGVIQYWVEPEEYRILTNMWNDISGYSNSTDFQTENSETLLKRVVQVTSDPGDTVMDFFLGSGTTTAVAHKMGRKWIGIEMGEHFYDITLPRMKDVLHFDSSAITGTEGVDEHYAKDDAGGFFKYYDLEQYEQALKKCQYLGKSPFEFSEQDLHEQYIFLNDLKMLDAVTVDDEEGISINFENLYENVDAAETLANLYGQEIKQIHSGKVEFTDGRKEYYEDLTVPDVKPLIWW